MNVDCDGNENICEAIIAPAGFLAPEGQKPKEAP